MTDKEMWKKLAEDEKLAIRVLDKTIDKLQGAIEINNIALIKELSKQADVFMSDLSVDNISSCTAGFIERAGETVGLCKIIKRIAEAHKEDED